jgi:CDP-glucose 4,6-dehydratase
MVDRQFWNKKKAFVTGHTGFKGGRLLEMCAEVTGYALKVDAVP